MNPSRLANVKSARDAYRGSQLGTSGYPIEAFFEVAARCNLRCQMCAINYDTRYQPHTGWPAYFAPELFARLRPMFPTLLRAYLFGLGEPTLNPHLVDYVRELSEAGAEVWFNTNATLIEDAKAESLAAAGASRITVSIDGATAETYEKIRRGATFESVLRGIRALVAAGIRVDLSMVAMASNVDEIPLLVDLCAENGAGGVHIEPLYFQPGAPELVAHYEREHLDDESRAMELLRESQERARRLGVHFQSRMIADEGNLAADWICTEPWSSIWVTTAGDVRTCCTNEVSFGSLHDNTIEEIWNGERFRAFRAQHARNEVADGCANCIANGRKRHSPFFRTLRPVTYRPLSIARPSPDHPIAIRRPESDDDVTDPLVIRGTIAAVDTLEYELMIDETPVANFHDDTVTRIEGSEFEMCVPVPFLTEGAHLLWTRSARDLSSSDPREVYFWR